MQDCSLDQTGHELIFFSFAESFWLLFLRFYCLLPKYLAPASQHFLPALTEDGCFDFSLKVFNRGGASLQKLGA